METVKTRKTVTVNVPRASAGEPQEIFVGVNGKGYRVRRGMDVEVPAAVAEVLKRSWQAEISRDDYVLEKESKPEHT